MLRKLFIAASVLLIAGCTNTYMNTTPGVAMPSGFAVCMGYDSVGRCNKWSSESETCINPKGINENPPTVPCASIKK